MEHLKKNDSKAKTMKIVLIFGVIALVAIGAFLANNFMAPKQLKSMICLDCPGGGDWGGDGLPPATPRPLVPTLLTPTEGQTFDSRTEPAVQFCAHVQDAASSYGRTLHAQFFINSQDVTVQGNSIAGVANQVTSGTSCATFDVSTLGAGSEYPWYANTITAAGRSWSVSSAARHFTVAALDTTPPVLTVTAPVNGATLTPGQTITVSGTATDETTYVTMLSIQIDALNPPQVVQNTTSANPWNWSSSLLIPSTLAAGTHTIKVQATDQAGNDSGTALKTINFTVGTASCSLTPSQITLWSPVDNSTIGGVLSFNGFTSAQPISAEVVIDKTTIVPRTLGSSTYFADGFFVPTTISDGTHTFEYRLHTANGCSSAFVNLTINRSLPQDTTNPSVAITSPSTDGTTVSTPTITVSGTAADNDLISYVRIHVNGVPYPSMGNAELATVVTPGEPSVTWTKAITLQFGLNTIEAYAYDNSGIWTKATRTVTLANTVATPTFNPPEGTYTTTQNVALSTTTAGATIRYNTALPVENKAPPTCTTGTVYTTPISVSETMMIRAIACKAGMTPSALATGQYSITPTNGATFQSGTFPTTMIVGQSYPISLTWKNTGTSTWTYKPQVAGTWRINRAFGIGIASPDCTGSPAPRFCKDQPIIGMAGPSTYPSGSPRVYISHDVLPNANYTYSFTVTPTAADIGTHSFAMGMLQESDYPPTDFKGEWFDEMPMSTITVSAPADTAKPTVTIDNIAPPACETFPTSFSGTTSDTGGSGIDKVDIVIRKNFMSYTTDACVGVNANIQEWDGSAWVSPCSGTTYTTQTRLTTTLNTAKTAWTYTGTMPPVSSLTDGIIYVYAEAIDAAGNPSTTYPPGYWVEKHFTYSTCAPTTYTLTTNVSPANTGTVRNNPVGSTYNAGTTVTLTAIPAFGYTFSNWSGDTTGTNATTTITMDSDKTVTAHFTALGTVAPPTFSPAGGTYTSQQSVTITSATVGATIRYTTDGTTTPSTTVGTVYSGAVSLTTTTTLKAIAYKTGMTSSAVATAVYTINTPTTCSIPLQNSTILGDVNLDCIVDFNDISSLANYFLLGAGNVDVVIKTGVERNGDINCDAMYGDLNDLAMLVNYFFANTLPPPSVCQNGNGNTNSGTPTTLSIQPNIVYFFDPSIWKLFLDDVVAPDQTLCNILPDPTGSPVPLDPPNVSYMEQSLKKLANLLIDQVDAQTIVKCLPIKYIPYPYARIITFTVNGIAASTSTPNTATIMMTKESSPSGPVALIYNNEPVTGTYANGTFTFKKYFKTVYQTTTTTGTIYPLSTRYLTAKFCEVAHLRDTVCLKDKDMKDIDLTSYFPPTTSTTANSQFIGNTSVTVNNSQQSNTQPLTFIKVNSRMSPWPIRVQYSPYGTANTIDQYNQSVYGICDASLSAAECAAEYPAN